jgi:monoamine oxidase
MRAVVIGAGFAGLAAADALARDGWEVVVLEARDRVGGRVWSRQLDDGSVVEMGAEFILAENSTVRETAMRLGLDLLDKGMSYGRRELRGAEPFDPGELDAAVAEIERAIAAGEGVGLSARALIDRLEMPPAVREALAARTEVSAASLAADVGSAALAMVAHIDDFPAPSVAGGNQRIALELARGLGDSVRLADPARAIAWSDDGVTVRTDAGEVSADRCVVAVPASVIDRISFEPALPKRLADALAGVSYGHAAKLFVPLREPAPPSAVLSVPGRYWVWTANGPDGSVQPVACCFAGSTAALERLAVTEGPATWTASLAGLRPDLDLDASAALVSTWDDDEWIRAAYSVWVEERIAGVLAAPHGPFAFAGEHTAGQWHGLMEGALRSGLRAAEALNAAPAAGSRTAPG